MTDGEASYMQNIKALIHEIEMNELALTVFNAERALAETNKELEVKTIGDCSLIIEPKGPKSIYYNRIKGFSNKDIDKLDEILEVYNQLGVTPAFDLNSINMTREVMQALIGEDYCYLDQLVYMVLEELGDYSVSKEIDIVPVTKESAEEYVRTILKSNPGMTVSQSVIDHKKTYFYKEAFQNFIAKIDGEVASMGSLFINGDTGYIANDYTFEKFRGRGCQSALLKHRMAIAKKMGLKKLVTDVEFGTQSQQNMERYGFRVVYLSAYWTRLD